MLLTLWAAALAFSLPLFGHEATARLQPLRRKEAKHEQEQTWLDRQFERGIGRLSSRAKHAIRESRLQYLSLILLGAIIIAAFSLKLGLLVAIGAAVSVPLRVRSLRRRRKTSIERQAPIAVDLFRVAIDSGMNISLATAAVAQRIPDPLGTELKTTVTRIAYGERVSDALSDLASRTSETLRPLTDSLVSAERYGSPISTVLERVAFEYRLTQERLADRNAKRLSLQVIIPLTCFTFPACVLLIATPIFASSFGSLAASFSF